MMLFQYYCLGLHYDRTAQEYQTIGKYVLQAPVHRFKTTNATNTPVLSNPSEKVCYIKKNHLFHWLFNECDPECLVLVKAKWFVHSFSFTNPKKAFSILAECDKGPLIIELDNTVGILFEIENKYQASIKILSNYVIFMLKKIKSRGSNALASVVDYNSHKQSDTNIVIAKNIKERTLNFEVVNANEFKNPLNGSHHSQYDDLGKHL